MKRRTLVRLQRTLGASSLALALLVMMIPGRAFAGNSDSPGAVVVDATASTIGHADRITAKVVGEETAYILRITDTDRHRLEALYGAFDPSTQTIVAYDMGLYTDAGDTPAKFSTVEITLPVPQSMDPEAGRLQIICDNDGKYQELSYSMRRDGSTYYTTFSTTHFSDYGFLYSQDQTPEAPAAETKELTAPVTYEDYIAGEGEEETVQSPVQDETVTMTKEGVCDVSKRGTLHYRIDGSGQNCTLTIFVPDGAGGSTEADAYDMEDYSYNETAGTYSYPWRYFADDIRYLQIGDGVRYIGVDAFAGLKNVVNRVTVPDSVEEIGSRAFYECENMANVTIGSGIQSIGAEAFARSGIMDVIFNPRAADQPMSVEERVFAECPQLIGTVSWPEGAALGEETFKDDTSLMSVELPSEGVDSIPDGCFQNCESLTYINYPSTLTSIGNHAFDHSGVTGSFSAFPDELTSVGDYAFYDSGFTEVDPVVPENLTTIGSHAFARCSGLEGELIIQGNATIGARAFSGDDVPEGEENTAATTGLDEIGVSRSGQLTRVDFVDTASVGAEAFAEQPYLTTVAMYGDPVTMVACDTPDGEGYSTQSFPTHVTMFYPVGKEGYDSPFYQGYPGYPVDFSQGMQTQAFAQISDRRAEPKYAEALMAIVSDNAEEYTLVVEDSEGNKIRRNMDLGKNGKLKPYELTLLNQDGEKARDFGVCKIYLPVPSGMKAQADQVEVVAMKEGEVERHLETGVITYREDGIQRIYFSTDHFSEYGLVLAAAEDNTSGGDNSGGNNGGGNGGNGGGSGSGGDSGTTATTPAAATATTPAATTATPAAATTTPAAAATTPAAAATTPTAVETSTSVQNNQQVSARDMPRTGEGDELRYLLALLLGLFGAILLIASIPTGRRVVVETKGNARPQGGKGRSSSAPRGQGTTGRTRR